ncbi:MAG: hypothetical protein ACOC97_06035 [Myxococcota bacterium]
MVDRGWASKWAQGHTCAWEARFIARGTLASLLFVLLVVRPGSADAQAGAEAPSGRRPVPVHLSADPHDLAVLVEDEQGQLLRLCSPPCLAALWPGEHRLWLQRGDGAPVRAAPSPVRLQGPVALQAAYRSNRGARIGAWISLAAASVLGAGLITLGARQLHRPCDPHAFDLCSPAKKGAKFFIAWGAAAAVSGVVTWAVLFDRNARATVRVRPAAW